MDTSQYIELNCPKTLISISAASYGDMDITLSNFVY